MYVHVHGCSLSPKTSYLITPSKTTSHPTIHMEFWLLYLFLKVRKDEWYSLVLDCLEKEVSPPLSFRDGEKPERPGGSWFRSRTIT